MEKGPETQRSSRGTPAAIGTEVRLGVARDISKNEGFPRDSANKVDSLCLIHFKGGALPRRPGAQGCAQIWLYN